MDGLRLRRPLDDLVEALVWIVPLSVPVLATIWHRSWRITVLLAATLVVVGLCFVGFTVIDFALNAGRWAK